MRLYSSDVSEPKLNDDNEHDKRNGRDQPDTKSRTLHLQKTAQRPISRSFWPKSSPNHRPKSVDRKYPALLGPICRATRSSLWYVPSSILKCHSILMLIQSQSIFDELVSELVNSHAQAAVQDIKHGRLPCPNCSTKSVYLFYLMTSS
jgi:hypothetical protein